MVSKDKITKILCSIDDLCNVFEPAFKERGVPDGKSVEIEPLK